MENSPAVNDKPTAMASLALSGNLLDVMLDTAMRFPRNLSLALEKTKEEIAIVPELAKRCYYSIPFRSDDESKKMVEGPSIKLANIVARHFKNCIVSGRIVEEDATRVKVEGICYDLENNVLRSAPISVSKTYKPKGQKGGVAFFPADQLNRQVQAGISKGARNAVFNVVPVWLVDECFQYAKHLVLNPPMPKGTAKPVKSVQERIQDARKLFKKDYKVTDAEMDAYLTDNCGGLDDGSILTHLVGLDTAFQEGHAKPDVVFGRTPPTESTGMPEEKSNANPAPAVPN